MITKEQIEKRIATEFYSPESAWIAKANITWAIEQLTPVIVAHQDNEKALHAELESLRAENETLRHNLNVFSVEHSRLQEDIKKMQAENRLLHEECSRRREDAHNWKQIAEIREKELQSEITRLRHGIERIRAIASMGDVNIQPLLAPIMDTAKNTLEK